jgi:glycosyltransferase involved in cell wall biosynthesis
MSYEPLVSIIITSYNYGRFLKEAVDSALNQTYRRIEVILVDDGSTDDSPAIICSYGERIIPLVKRHGGEVSACNAGFAHSRGEIVVFLDSDDVLLPNIIQRVVQAFRSSPGAGKVQYRMEIIDATGRRLGAFKPSSHLRMPSGDLRHRFLHCFEYVHPPTSGNAFSAEVLKSIFPLDQAMCLNTDHYLQNLVVLLGSVVSLDHVGAYFRQHGSNAYDVYQTDVVVMRQDIVSFINLHWHVKKIADGLALDGCPMTVDEVLSPYFLSKRLASYKLDATSHPIKNDAVLSLVIRGLIASMKNPFWSVHEKIVNVLWFCAMGLAPPCLSLWLAARLYYPERREWFNKAITFTAKVRRLYDLILAP